MEQITKLMWTANKPKRYWIAKHIFRTRLDAQATGELTFYVYTQKQGHWPENELESLSGFNLGIVEGISRGILPLMGIFSFLERSGAADALYYTCRNKHNWIAFSKTGENSIDNVIANEQDCDLPLGNDCPMFFELRTCFGILEIFAEICKNLPNSRYFVVALKIMAPWSSTWLVEIAWCSKA